MTDHLNPQERVRQALFDHNMKDFQSWLDEGGDPHMIFDWGESLLHTAAFHDNLEAVKLLLELGVDPNVRNRDGITPIFNPHKAETVIMLHEHGASLEIENEEYGFPLHHAAYDISVEKATTMVALGADMHAERSVGGLPAIYNTLYSDNSIAMFMAFISMGYSVNGVEGWPLLHEAYLREKYEILELLFKLGADPKVKDDNGRDFEAYKLLVAEVGRI